MVWPILKTNSYVIYRDFNHLCIKPFLDDCNSFSYVFDETRMNEFQNNLTIACIDRYCNKDIETSCVIVSEDCKYEVFVHFKGPNIITKVIVMFGEVKVVNEWKGSFNNCEINTEFRRIEEYSEEE